MKNIKKVLSLLLVLLLICVVSGCGENKDPILESIKVDSTTIPTSILNTEVDNEITKIKIILVYSDKSEKTKNLSKDMISEEDYNKLSSKGTYEITVTYEEKTTTLSLVITEKEDVKPSEEKKIVYTVYIEDIAQKPLANFYVQFCLNNEVVDEGYTKTDGTYTTELKANTYDVIIEEREEYYLNQNSYKVDVNNPTLNIISEINNLDGKEADPTEHRYEKGDVMYDFTITDIDGNKFRLYELLETKKAVIINFWYTTCSACNSEFPYLNQAYESTYINSNGEEAYYKDDIVIIAVNPGIAGNGDSVSDVENYRDSMGLTINVAMDIDYDTTNLTMDPALHDMFSINAYPTTIIIDQYGLIAELAIGAVTGVEKWTQEFDKYLVENYTPKYEITDDSEGLKLPPEDLEFPSSSDISNAINGTNHDKTKFETTYTASEEEYAWPWIIDTYDGKNVIKPSNSFENFSYSMIYFDVYLKKGEVLTFDYFSSCEDYDILSVIVNNSEAVEIAGVNTEWKKCYAYVAIEEGNYNIALCYLKDKTYSSGDDVVYITNIKIETEESIDQETYIFRDCAQGDINEITMSYESYVDVVYNEQDGYYHVNSANGPFLLANLLDGSKWNENALYALTLENLCIGSDGVDYNDIIVDYSVYAANSLNGYTVITEELAKALKEVTKALGAEEAKENENQWLEVCVYYSAYGTNGEELANPNIGISPFAPIKFEGDGIESPAKAEATFTQVIFPRGMYFAFTATKNGVYKFYSTLDELETEGWICDKDGNVLSDTDEELRIFAEKVSKGLPQDKNFIAYVYLEAGETYLFIGAFYDIYEFSTLTVEMAYETDSIELLTLASPGYFTTADDEMTEIISGNYIDVKLGADGYYHVVDSKASNDYVYCDITYINNPTSTTLQYALDINAFDFSKDTYGKKIYDENGYYLMTVLDDDSNLTQYYVCYDAEGEEYYVETIGQNGYTEENGYTYLKFTEEEIAELEKKDYTEYVRKYIEEKLITDESSELYGCVLVDEEFANVLQYLMGKYQFEGIDGSWLKLCYYYKYVGPEKAE